MSLASIPCEIKVLQSLAVGGMIACKKEAVGDIFFEIVVDAEARSVKIKMKMDHEMYFETLSACKDF